MVVIAVLLLAVAGTTIVPTVGADDPPSQPSDEVTRGEPDLDVHLSDNEVAPGTETNLEFEILNDGEMESGTETDQVLTARGVTTEIVDDGPFEAQSGVTPLAEGQIQDGSVATAPHQIVVPDDVEPGEYTVSIEVEYSYIAAVSRITDNARKEHNTETYDVTVEVPDEPRFDVTNASTEAEPGASGDATIEVENVGTDAAYDLEGSVTGQSGITFDGEVADAYLGDLEAGESTTMTVEADVPETTSEGEKPFTVEFSYEDGNGVEQSAGPERGSLAPAESISFTMGDVEDTLMVGYDGDVTGTVTNDGPRPVDDAVLIAEPQSDSLHVEDTRYALPELKPGETVDFRYPTDVSGQADEGPRQIQFSVEYTDSDRTFTSDRMSQRVVVDPREDEFSLETVDAQVAAGETTEIALEITNERPETLSNIDAMLYADSPLDSDGDEAFVDELAPGESAEITFELEADDDARETTYPVELDFEYDTERGETELSDAYQHPIEVTANEGGGGGFPFLTTGLGALTVVGVGVGLWMRRS